MNFKNVINTINSLQKTKDMLNLANNFKGFTFLKKKSSHIKTDL